MANATTLTGSAISGASSPDPDKCRISGYLINAHGHPLKGWAFVLRYCYSPLGLANGTLVLQEKLTIRADKDGYVEFDLLRGAEVTVELPNLLIDLDTKGLKVPDAASLELMAFLFPYVLSVDWEDPGPFALGVNEVVTLAVVGTLTNGETVSIPSAALTLSSSNDSVVTKKEGLAYIGVSAGPADISVDAVDASLLDLNQDREENDLVFFDVPSPTLPASPVTVTVS